MSPDRTPEDARLAFDAEEALAALRRNDVRPEPLPRPGDPRWGLSAILRPDRSSDAVAAAARAAERIGSAAGSHHVVYGPDELHVTVRSVESFRAVRPGDEHVERCVEVLAREARTLRPLRLRFAGVAPTRSGVLSPAVGGDEALRGLRERLHAELAAAAPLPGPEADRPRTRTHMSLVLFTGPLADPAATAATLLDLREADLGEAEFDRVELVRYERGPQSVRIVTLWEAPLSG